MPTTPVVQGTFGRVTMDDLLGVVAMSRQCLEVVLGASGTMTVKSGQVLEASAGPGEQGAAAFFTLYGRPGSQYAVYRKDPPSDPITPIGTVSSLVERARRLPEPGTTLLAGSFDDFSFADLIGAVSTSRQALLITLIRADGHRARLRVKAGLVLSCEDPGPNGPRSDREALHAVLRDPGRQFVVTQLKPTPTGPPIARLADLAAAAAKQGRRQVLLEGPLADFPLADVLSTLTLTRQAIELTTSDASGVAGTLILKSGQVLDLRSRNRTGREAFAAWIANPGDRFTVIKARIAPGAAPLARLSDWLTELRAPEGPRPLLDGRFAEFPLRDVLTVLGTSRQALAMELWRDGRPRGRLLVKAGVVLEATTVEALAGAAAAKALVASPGDRFSVTRALVPAGARPIGRLADLMRPAERAPAPAAVPSAEAVVLEGRFAESPLVDLLGVLSLSRACLELRMPRRSGPARLVTKAGQLLSASLDGERDPVRVLAALVADPGETFSVVRIDTPAGARPQGPLHELLAEAHHLSEDLATVVGFPHGAPIDSLRSLSRPSPEPPATAAPATAAPVIPPPAAPPPAADPRLDQIFARLDGLQASLARVGSEAESLKVLAALEERIAAQDRAIDAWGRASRTDRLLVLLVLLVQVLTAGAVVVISVWTVSWNP